MNHAKAILQIICVGMILVGLMTTAWAHGKGVHVLGTVTEMDGSTLMVKTRDNKTVSVTLTPKTQFKPVGKGTTTGKPQVGDRVVIEATQANDELTAKDVRFSTVNVKQP